MTISDQYSIDNANYHLSYKARNPRHGHDHGLGMHDYGVLDAYKQGLEMTAVAMQEGPFARPPLPEPAQVVVVPHIPAGSARTVPASTDALFPHFNLRLPRIELSCYCYEPCIDCALLEARAQALHEFVHVFNAVHHPLDDPLSNAWLWLDEATALYLEAKLLPAHNGYLRFVAPWNDHPDDSLDNPSAAYC